MEGKGGKRRVGKGGSNGGRERRNGGKAGKGGKRKGEKEENVCGVLKGKFCSLSPVFLFFINFFSFFLIFSFVIFHF